MSTFIKFFIIAFLAITVFSNISASIKVPITINDSGLEFQANVASANVADALKELNITLAKEDIILPGLQNKLRPADNIFIKRSVPVNIVFDGQTKNTNTHTLTVWELIEEQGIEVKELDKVTPPKDSNLTSGLTIEIVRVTKGVITKEVPIPIKKTEQDDAELSLGKTKVLQKGEEGIIKEEWEIIYENNKEVKRKLVKKETTKEMKPEIIALGTKVEIGKTYIGLASWYGVRGLTAASLQFPFGTKLRVINTNSGASVVVTVNDRGPFIEGRIIDLSKEAFSRIESIGRGVASVRVEEML